MPVTPKTREKIEKLRRELVEIQNREEELREEADDLRAKALRLAIQIERLDPPEPPKPGTLEYLMEQQYQAALTAHLEQTSAVAEVLFGGIGKGH